MAEVHSIYGGKITSDGANQEVIDELSNLLEEAKRGEITAFAIAFVNGTGCANSQVTGSNGRAAELGGSIGMMHHRYFASWRDISDRGGG